MIPKKLEEVERDFRRSVERRNYRDLACHTTDLRMITAAYLASLPANDPARRELISWAIALTDWGRKMICAQRQRWANQKKPLTLIGRYFQRPASPASQICIDL
jgi:hypothetical protein